ncbi:MAG: hypothetical protein OEX17_03440 [Rhodospirillaceae bacterium]|nr:hypothetical protein [Rhodospirillaceae bacterium]
MATTNTDQTGAGDERRNDVRIDDPSLVVKVDGKTYNTVNWSMGGFLIEGYEGALSTGALLTVAALGTNAKDLTDVCIRARVVRSDPEKGYIAVNFLGLDSSAFSLLRTFTDIKSKARTPY